MASTRVALVSVVVLAVLTAACASAHAASIASARRALTPEAAADLAARGLAVPGAVLSRAEADAHAARAHRERSYPHVLSAPGLDWSLDAARRPSWRRPSRPSSAEQLATGRVAPAVTPADGYWDTLKVCILRVDFLADRAGDRTTGNGRFDLSADTTRPPIDRPPHNRTFYQRHGEALERYYDVQTYGRVLIETEVWPRSEDLAYSVSDLADFGPWKFSPDIYGAAVHMMRTMFFAADSQSIALGDRIPWDDYDRFIIIHAGSDYQSDVRQDTELDIPSFTVGVSDTDLVVFPDSTTRPIDRAAFIPETITQDLEDGALYGAINGVLAHECGHLFFGFFDVYDIASGNPVCGYWTLMDSGNNAGVQVHLADGTVIYVVGLLPPSLDPFHRAFTTDVLPLDPLEWDADTPLRSSQRHPDIRRLDLTADEYLLIENRWQAPGDSLRLDQDSTTRVIMGPLQPDRFEYDALLAGGGVIVWHVDGSVTPLEFAFPLDTALRVNADFGLNSNPWRRGLRIVEADGLGDLGDGSSPFWWGSPYDPYFVGNNTVLSDTTIPRLIPNLGTRPHVRLDVLDPRDSTMRVRASRTWAMAGWPRRAAFPPGGADLLAIDADGDGESEIAWAGGTREGADSCDVFVMRLDGSGLGGPDPRLARLTRRPDPRMAAAAVPGAPGGARFALVTRRAFEGDTAAGWLHVLTESGAEAPGFPVKVGPEATPPVIVGAYPNAAVFVGRDDGRVHGWSLADGTYFFASDALGDTVAGRIAVRTDRQGSGSPTLGAPPDLAFTVAAGDANGHLLSESACYGTCALSGRTGGWNAVARATAGIDPDFLFLPFGGDGAAASSPCGAAATLVMRDADRLHAYCADGTPLPGWGRALPDSLAPGLGVGDPDGDGYPEVLVQTVRSGLAFVNVGGSPSPGWPKRPTDEDLRSASPPLAADVDGDGRTEVVALGGTGKLVAMNSSARVPAGWPLATGAGVRGGAVVADLDGDGFLELVAPDNVDRLWGFALGAPANGRAAAPWPMAGGDAGRSCALPLERASVARAASAGPLVPGTLMAYPNPARQRPVNFAFTLTEPARAEFRVLDTSGHEVASFARDGIQSENLVTWDPGALPAGLYLVQVRLKGAAHEHRQLLQVGVLR